jgi:hypothetical protein
MRVVSSSATVNVTPNIPNSSSACRYAKCMVASEAARCDGSDQNRYSKSLDDPGIEHSASDAARRNTTAAAKQHSDNQTDQPDDHQRDRPVTAS